MLGAFQSAFWLEQPKALPPLFHGAGQLLVFPFGVAWETSPWPWKFPLAFPGHQWSRWLFAVKCVQHVESSCARVQKPICFRPVSQAMCPRQWVSTSVCCAGVAYMCSTLALTCGLEHPVWSCSWSRIPIWAINSIFMSIIDPSFCLPWHVAKFQDDIWTAGSYDGRLNVAYVEFQSWCRARRIPYLTWHWLLWFICQNPNLPSPC